MAITTASIDPFEDSAPENDDSLFACIRVERATGFLQDKQGGTVNIVVDDHMVTVDGSVTVDGYQWRKFSNALNRVTGTRVILDAERRKR